MTPLGGAKLASWPRPRRHSSSLAALSRPGLSPSAGPTSSDTLSILARRLDGRFLESRRPPFRPEIKKAGQVTSAGLRLALVRTLAYSSDLARARVRPRTDTPTARKTPRKMRQSL